MVIGNLKQEIHIHMQTLAAKNQTINQLSAQLAHSDAEKEHCKAQIQQLLEAQAHAQPARVQYQPSMLMHEDT